MNVGGAEPVVASAASKGHFSAVFVTRAIDDPPFAMIQGEGANAGTHHNWEEISSMVKMFVWHLQIQFTFTQQFSTHYLSLFLAL